MTATGERATACPTCGKDGPDHATWIFDAGVWEASCGDEWHEEMIAV